MAGRESVEGAGACADRAQADGQKDQQDASAEAEGVAGVQEEHE